MHQKPMTKSSLAKFCGLVWFVDIIYNTPSEYVTHYYKNRKRPPRSIPAAERYALSSTIERREATERHPTE